MRILIAEDDAASRRLLRVNLVFAGHEVLEAEDGQIAWDMLQNEHIRMVITDWMMPGLAGPDLVRRIRSELQPGSGYTYTIIITALGDKTHLLDGLDAGADDYLTKPYYTEELVARVKIGVRILQGLEDGLLQANEQMEYQARHDALTRLLNRRAIEEYAREEVQRAARISTPISILLVDMDHFKSINDRYGHSSGDQALRLFADFLQQSVRPYDRAGRWGGEEFLCVLPGTTAAEASQAAERIRSALDAMRLPIAEGHEVHVTVSIGVASVTNAAEGAQLEQVVHAADQALYRAKNEGRNRICIAE